MKGDLFTLDSFATLAGASFGVYVISSVIQHVFRFNPKWFGFVLSFLFSFLGVYLSKKTGQYYILAFFNGFLIYANVVGIVAVTGKESSSVNDNSDGPYGDPSDSSMTKRSFRTKWY